MSEFRLRAAVPGSGIVQTLRNARAVGSGDVVDVELTDAVVTAIRPADALTARGEVTDLDGRIVVPGLSDHHVHFTQWAIASKRIDVSAAGSAPEAVHLLRAAANADGIVVGVGFRDALWPASPVAGDLDAAFGRRPVVVISGDLHAAWLSSAALRDFGFAPGHGGLVSEEDAFRVQKALDEIPPHVSDAWARDAADAAAARGVTAITDMEMAWNRDVWARRAQAGATQLRVAFGIYAQDLERAVAEGLATGRILPHTHGLVSVGPFKAITDGSLNTRTAYCDDPYPGMTGDDAHGILSIGPDRLRQLMTIARDAGISCAVHAIGDHANALALDAYEATGARGTIEHAQLMRQADIPRLARSGIIASVQPEHAMDDRDVADRHWAGRTGRAFMLRSFIEAGVHIVLGSDAPVAPLDPWAGIAAATARSRDGREPWHPEQRISVETALAASTGTGRLRLHQGEPADIAVLDADPLSATASELRGMPVAGTLLNGRWTHRAL